MKRAGYLKHKKLIKAWAKGAEVQYKNPIDTSWKDFRDHNNPTWQQHVDYRIKPTLTEIAKSKDTAVYENDKVVVIVREIS